MSHHQLRDTPNVGTCKNLNLRGFGLPTPLIKKRNDNWYQGVRQNQTSVANTGGPPGNLEESQRELRLPPAEGQV